MQIGFQDGLDKGFSQKKVASKNYTVEIQFEKIQIQQFQTWGYLVKIDFKKD